MIFIVSLLFTSIFSPVESLTGTEPVRTTIRFSDDQVTVLTSGIDGQRLSGNRRHHTRLPRVYAASPSHLQIVRPAIEYCAERGLSLFECVDQAERRPEARSSIHPWWSYALSLPPDVRTD